MGFPPNPPRRDRSRPLRLTSPVPIAVEETESEKQAEVVEKLGKGLVFWLMKNSSPKTRTAAIAVVMFGAGWIARHLPPAVKALGLQTAEESKKDREALDAKIAAVVKGQQASSTVEEERWKKLEAAVAAEHKANIDNAAKVQALTRQMAKRPPSHTQPKDPAE